MAMKPVLSQRPENKEDSKWPPSKKREKMAMFILVFAVGCVHFFFGCWSRVPPPLCNSYAKVRN